MPHLRAFTLLEVVVSLALSSVVLAAGLRFFARDLTGGGDAPVAAEAEARLAAWALAAPATPLRDADSLATYTGHWTDDERLPGLRELVVVARPRDSLAAPYQTSRHVYQPVAP